MDREDRPHYETRKSTGQHSDFIRNSRPPKDGDLAELIELVFGHQPAVFRPAGDPPAPLIDPKLELIARQFYAHHFVDVVLRADVYNGRILSLEDFIRTVIFASPQGNRNNLHFLLGAVGCGKTAFLNYLITKYAYAWVTQQRLWFVRLDLYLLGDGANITLDTMIEGLVRKILHIFGSARESDRLPA